LLALQLIGPEDTLVIPHDCYGGSYRLFLNLATRKKAFQLVVVNFQQTDWAEQVKAAQPKMIWVETPSNPLLQITDVKATAELAKTLNAILVVDNTFLSPALQNPIALGADIVVHSTTKFINGHSDIVGGALIAKDAAVGDELKWWANCLGVTGGAFDAYQTLRGLRTLLPRIKQHQHNAELVVDFLQKQPLVGRVYYPGLKDHPGYAIAKAQQHGFGSMLSFDLAADEAYLAVFFEALQCFTLAQSLGGIESLICHPGSMTHASLDAATQKAAGIGPTLIRLSVGIEEAQDLIADLAQAFAAVDAAVKQNTKTQQVQSEPAVTDPVKNEQQQFRLNPALSVLW
jgi:cystathionine gamma-synthase